MEIVNNKKILDFGLLPTSIGELIGAKFYFDLVKDQYDEIRVGICKKLWEENCDTKAPGWAERSTTWSQFLDDVGQLFFSPPPYVYLPEPNRYGGNIEHVLIATKLVPQKPELGHILCKGKSLDIGPYIVMTTKVREADRNVFIPLSMQLWKILKEKSEKYKIVVIGERNVEMRKEYNNDHRFVFGLYDQIVCNLSADRIVDLTVPALGETANTLIGFQQDCLIMKEAQAVITIGIGGNHTISSAVSNLAIGFRTDKNLYTDMVFNREYPNAVITKDWGRFIGAIKEL